MKHSRPKTIDGVPVKSGMILYFRRPGLPHCERVKSVQGGVVRSDYAASIFPYRIIEPNLAYSTFDAAQAAGSKT